MTSDSRAFRTLLGALLAIGLASACSARSLPDDVMGVVDDHEIRRDDVEKAYRQVQQKTPTPPADDEVNTVKLGIVDELITQQVLSARAKALKLDVTDAEVEAAFGDRKKNMTEEQFNAQLHDRNLTQDDMRAAVRRELISQKVLEHEVFSKIVVSDQEVSDYYNANKAQFDVKETAYHIAQIVITPMKEPQQMNRLGDDAKTPEEAQKKAAMLMDKLKAGTNFQQLAGDYSEDPTSAQGGDLGFVSASDLNKVPAALRDAVLKLQPNGVTLVAGGGGFNIVALVEKANPGLRDLNSPGVREGISGSLRDRREQLLKVAYITTLRNDAKIINAMARQLMTTTLKAPPTAAPAAPGK